MMTDIIIDVPGIKVQRFGEDHIDAILALMNKEGWYYYDRRELSRYLSLDQFAFVLMEKNRPIGSIFTTNYGNQAWIGNIVVAEAARGRGLATRMIRGVVDHLRNHRRITTFRLGSVPLAIGLYKKIGFRPEAFTTAQEAALPIALDDEPVTLPAGVTVAALRADDMDAVGTLDARFFRSERLPLLNALYADAIRESCWALKDRGRLVGFSMIRRRQISKTEGRFAEGPDQAYRLGPCCVHPDRGIDGFRALCQKALPAVNDDARRLGGSARIYVVFPRNADKEGIYGDTRDLAAAMGVDAAMDLDGVFDDHDHIFGAAPSEKNAAQRRYMAGLGFTQEYFEQVMCLTAGDNESPSAQARGGNTRADPEGIFASATPGDKA